MREGCGEKRREGEEKEVEGGSEGCLHWSCGTVDLLTSGLQYHQDLYLQQ